MECKSIVGNTIKVYVNLIKVEPYWNVNVELLTLLTQNRKIKVEPYWNVNVNIPVQSISLNN